MRVSEPARAGARGPLRSPEANPLGEFCAGGAEARRPPVHERGVAAIGPPMARARKARGLEEDIPCSPVSACAAHLSLIHISEPTRLALI
eukprot:12057874-Alexandrium_andersonii.AAC.1